MKGSYSTRRRSNAMQELFPDVRKNPEIVWNTVGFLYILMVAFQEGIHTTGMSQDALPGSSVELPENQYDTLYTLI